MSLSSSALSVEALIAADIHRRIGSNVECELFDILRSVPCCLAGFWLSVRPAFDACFVRSCACELRQRADIMARGAFAFPNHLMWLRDHDYSREDSRQIRYVVEAFYNLEPVFAVMASLALRWLARDVSECVELPDACGLRETPAVFTGVIELSDEVLGHPFTRALGMWPEYLATVQAGAEINMSAVSESMACLGGVLGSSTRLIPLAKSPGAIACDGLAPRIRHWLNGSLKAILLASALRRSFTRAEIAARNRHIRSAVA